MEIIFHAHNAVISEHMQQKAERVVRRLASRIKRPVDAIVRFANDGQRSIVAADSAQHYGPALSGAADRVEAQLDRLKRTPKARARASSRNGTRPRAS